DRVGVADAHHAEAVVEVDVLASVDVPNQRSLAAVDIDRPGVVELEGRWDPAGHHLAGPVEVLRRGGRVLAEASHLLLRELVDLLAVDGRLASGDLCRLLCHQARSVSGTGCIPG